ncbi:MAG: hypothetical protein GY829_07560 [Gammaproteobacteria bacterium]|jgi:hypothetical protein|nr:hypothetical protein [Gammaproteobacteria bacterium]
MTNLIENSLVKTFTTRLPVSLFQHIKAQDNPSDFIRKLVEKDMVQHDKA